MEVSSAVIGSGAHVAMVATVNNASGIGKAMRRCTPLNHAAALWKLSGQSDSDPQRYLRKTHADRQTEIPCFYREMFNMCQYSCT